MKFKRLEIPDVVLCQPTIFLDDRGYFTEKFRQDKLEAFLGYNINFCQDNESKSCYGVIRGLHYQVTPNAQTKLIQVNKGLILDVAVDIRKDSKTFGNYVAVELSSENKSQLLIPRGFAHGFVVLSKEAIVSYKVDNYYSSKFEKGILFNDKKLGIDWKIDKNEQKISPKDINQPKFEDAVYFDNSIDLYE